MGQNPGKGPRNSDNDEYEDRPADDESAGRAQHRIDEITRDVRRSQLTRLSGIGEAKARALREAGYETIEDVREAGQDALAEVSGIGETTAEQIQSAARRVSQQEAGDVETIGGANVGTDAATITIGGQSFDDPNEAARHLGPTDEQAIDVALGTTDPREIETEFGIGLSETDIHDDLTNSEVNTPYPTFTSNEAQNVQNALVDKHGKEAVDRVYDLINSWKGSSGGEKAETLELIAKKALGIGAPVRTDGKNVQDVLPDGAEIDTYRDLTRISRAFMQRHMPADSRGETSVTLHRGIRHSNEPFTAQLIDNPNADEYRFPTIATSNHSIDSGVAEHWAEAYTISHRATPDDVALAIDVLRPHGLDEGEVHIIGDDVRVPGAGVTFTGPRHQDLDSQNAQGMFSALDTPEKADAETHDRLYGLIHAMDRADYAPETTAGATRVKKWFESCIRDDRFKDTSQATAYKTVRSALDASGTGVTLDLNRKDVL